jgi:hypothetical protein
MNPELEKFTFHTAMLRDKLRELSMGGDIEIVKKVPGLSTFHVHRKVTN